MVRVSLPIVEGGASGENLTLSESELEACRPMRLLAGRKLRAFCPFHGSDHQRSLEVNRETGHFHCFSCNAWGYLEWARDGKTVAEIMSLVAAYHLASGNPPAPGILSRKSAYLHKWRGRHSLQAVSDGVELMVTSQWSII